MTTSTNPRLSSQLSLLGGRCRLLHSDILFIEAQRSYTVFWCRNGKYIMTSKPMGSYEKELPSHFVRVHKSFIVNLNYITAFDGTTLYLKDGKKVIVSRRRKAFLRSLLGGDRAG